MRKRRVLGLGGLVLLGAFAYWRWTRITPPVTEAEARRYLDRIVAAAQARDLNRVCHLNGAVHNCLMTLDYIGGKNPETTIPTEPPTVVGTRYHQEHGDTAGRVLIVEGTDGRGKHYRTEVFVFRENRYHFKAINAVYWSGALLLEDGDTRLPQVSPSGAAAS